MPGLVLTAPFALAQKDTPGLPHPLPITPTNNLWSAPEKVIAIASLVSAHASMDSGEKVAAVVPAQMNAVDMVCAKVWKNLQVTINHMILHKTLPQSMTLRGMQNTSTGANVTMVSVVQTAAKLNAHPQKILLVEKETN